MRLVEFSMSGCPYCEQQKRNKVMETLAAEFRGTQFTRVDVDVREDLAELFNITALPVYCLVNSLGQIVARVESSASVDELRGVLRKFYAT